MVKDKKGSEDEKKTYGRRRRETKVDDDNREGVKMRKKQREGKEGDQSG